MSEGLRIDTFSSRGRSRVHSYIPKRNGTLADATAKLIEACGGLAPAAEMCRVSTTMLSNYMNPEQTAVIPADIAMTLEHLCGKAFITDHMTASHGGRLMIIDGPTDRNWLRYVGDLTKDYAKAISDTTKALEDNRISEDEAREICEALLELSRKALSMHSALKEKGASK